MAAPTRSARSGDRSVPHHLAVERRVAASTQNQAFSALLFLYRHVLQIELTRIDAMRAKRPDRLPVVLSIDEVRAIFDRMTGIHRLRVFDLEGGTPHGRSSVGFGLASPTRIREVKKSQAI